MRLTYVFLLLAALLGVGEATVALAATQDERRATSGAAPPPISLPANASLDDTLQALRAATGLAVLAEPPLLERRLKVRLEAVPITEALAEVSRSLDLYWVRGPQSIALLRRYSDYRELP